MKKLFLAALISLQPLVLFAKPLWEEKQDVCHLKCMVLCSMIEEVHDAVSERFGMESEEALLLCMFNLVHGSACEAEVEALFEPFEFE